MMHIVLRWLQQQSCSQLDGDATFDHREAYSQHNQLQVREFYQTMVE